MGKFHIDCYQLQYIGVFIVPLVIFFLVELGQPDISLISMTHINETAASIGTYIIFDWYIFLHLTLW